MHQRPAAVRALNAAEVDRDLGFQRRIDRLAEIVPQQNVFGRDGRVGLKLEHEMTVRLPEIEETARGGADAAPECGIVDRRGCGVHGVHGG